MTVISGNKIDNTPQPIKVDDEGRQSITADVSAPIPITAPQAIPVEVESVDGIAQTQTVANSRAITNASQDIALPETNGLYILQARGNDVCIKTVDAGTGPTVTAVAGGFSLYIFDGQTIETQLAGNRIAWVSAAEAGGIFVICHKET